MSSTAQHMAALEKARVVKQAHWEIRKELASSELALGAALRDPRAARMTVWGLLQAQRRWGPDRCWKTLRAAGRILWPKAIEPPPLAPYLTVGELRERQRTALLQACGRRP